MHCLFRRFVSFRSSLCLFLILKFPFIFYSRFLSSTYKKHDQSNEKYSTTHTASVDNRVKPAWSTFLRGDLNVRKLQTYSLSFGIIYLLKGLQKVNPKNPANWLIVFVFHYWIGKDTQEARSFLLLFVNKIVKVITGSKIKCSHFFWYHNSSICINLLLLS